MLAVKVSESSAKIARALMKTYLGKKATLSRRRSLVEAAGTRAAAAVWKYNRDTDELTMYWLLDNDSKHTYRVGLRRLTSTDVPLAAECEVGG